MLELKRLKVLREVARQGSFAGAAAALNFTPSAISQQIAQLERETGVQLVERKRTGVVLTRAGQVLLAHANAMLARAQDAEEEIRLLAAGEWGRLRVAAFASAAAALMPQTILAFREAQPRVAIELVEQEGAVSLDELYSGDLDLAIVVLNGQPRGDDVELIRLFDDVIDVLLPVNHQRAEAETVTLDELRDDAWIDCSGSPVRSFLGARGIEPNIVFESDHHYVVQGLVAAGVAVALSPRLTQPVLRSDVLVKPVSPDPPIRPVGLAVRADKRDSSATASLIAILQRVAMGRATDETSAPLELVSSR